MTSGTIRNINVLLFLIVASHTSQWLALWSPVGGEAVYLNRRKKNSILKAFSAICVCISVRCVSLALVSLCLPTVDTEIVTVISYLCWLCGFHDRFATGSWGLFLNGITFAWERGYEAVGRHCTVALTWHLRCGIIWLIWVWKGMKQSTFYAVWLANYQIHSLWLLKENTVCMFCSSCFCFCFLL